MVEEDTQSDSKHRTTVGYVKTTASKVHTTLVAKYGYKEDNFSISTINNVLNRLGYSLKKVQKTKPLKRLEETDSIFENVHSCVEQAKANNGVFRISVDVKDKVKVGELSRKGYSRSRQAVKAADKDQKWDCSLIPVGILEVDTAQSHIFFGNSVETSDLIADCIQQWANTQKEHFQFITRLQIYLDNGPHCNSRRTQFMKRIALLACELDIEIELIYYPPYHSKYNPIERVWAGLENYWNGTLLNSVKKVVATAKNMTWKGIHPISKLIDKTYEHGVKLTAKKMKELDELLIRNEEIPKWHVQIIPNEKMRTLFSG